MKRTRSQRFQEEYARNENIDLQGEESITPKRRRTAMHLGLATPEDSTDFDSEGASNTSELASEKTYRQLSHIGVHGPAFPRSQYEGWLPPLTPTRESDAISYLEGIFENQMAGEGPDYTYFSLDHFSIYRPPHPRHGYALCSLDQLRNRDGINEFLFDGILSVGSERRYVQGIPFDIVAVEGYGDPELIDMTGCVCIQSKHAEKRGVWYRLGTASPVYQRFFEPYLWLVTFTKFFVDYVLEHEKVTLHHFRREFLGFLYARHSDEPGFRSWLAQCNLRDFRTTIAAHVGYLEKECFGLRDHEPALLDHPIWGEVHPKILTAIPEQPSVERNTIVTPFVYQCFQNMYFSEKLEARTPENRVICAVRERKRELGLTPLYVDGSREAALHTPSSLADAAETGPPCVREGDIVTISPSPRSRFKSTTALWYAYVQGKRSENRREILDVIWLYEPQDTTLGAAYYPFSNELFFSDNCACSGDAVDIECVLEVVSVTFFVKDPTSVNGIFVRSKYRTCHSEDTYDFISLRESDFKCRCQSRTRIFEECRSKYEIGDTVLVRVYNSKAREDRLEPSQIVDFDLEKRQVVLRRFRRQQDFDKAARPNELVLTNDIITKSAGKVIRACQVRFFHVDVVQEGLPTPYDQGGAGDHFFIVRSVEQSGSTSPAGPTIESDAIDSGHSRQLPPLSQGWDPEAEVHIPKMKGMGIFCGGGNFDRGLAEGGAVEFRYGIDWATHALHSYRASSKDPSKLQLYLGSVNDYLAQALAGSGMEAIAGIGDFQFLAAGSPCPGFSRANNNKCDDQSLRNASMVASVASFVDVYSPEYCILENVIPMAQGMGPNKDQNVFSQILAAFVAMGYQVQQFLMESWFFSSSQQRSRLFIVASAPGREPLQPPPYTHANADDGRKQTSRAIGWSSNGLPFGLRRDDFTTFDHVSPEQATSDLPDIGDSQPQLCPAFPDHRTIRNENNQSRGRIAIVPKFPRGMGLVQAVRAPRCSRITGEPLEYYNTRVGTNKIKSHDRSNVYARIEPQFLFPTILTAQYPEDGVHGRNLHWEQYRTLTVMELRRAQGFHDDDVLVGTTAQQVHIIGNSVDRQCALALGLGLRHSWSTGISQSPDEPMDSTDSIETLSIDKLQLDERISSSQF